MIANIGSHSGRFIALRYSDNTQLYAVTEDGRIGLWNLASLSEGTAFDVACTQLEDRSLEDALRGYPIRVSAPICEDEYAPPLPEWMGEAHSAIGFTP